MCHIVVIGSGITGVTSAYELAQLGYQVTVIDKHLFPAMETSFANGGQLSYRYVAPLADAGVPFQALQWLGKAHSPLNFKLNASPFQWSWLLQFLFACNRKANIANGNHILRLSLYSQSIMSKWRDEIDNFDWVKSGKMIIHRNQKAFKKANGVTGSELAKRMSLYKVPELIFVKDESVEYGNKIDELLRNLNKN